MSGMSSDLFLQHLKSEFERRKKSNERYSLRSFARFLGINHATLSGLMSGKRSLGDKVKNQLAAKIDPENVYGFVSVPPSKALPMVVLDENTFNEISDWYFDALLELIQIQHVAWSAEKAAQYLGLSLETVRQAIEKLTQIGLIEKNEQGLRVKCAYSTNLPDNERTSASMRQYQKAVLGRSMDALGEIDRKWRDHQSTMLAISKKDVQKVKEIVRNFSYEISAFLQAEDKKKDFDEVYQLAISFFPLNKSNNSDLKTTAAKETK